MGRHSKLQLDQETPLAIPNIDFTASRQGEMRGVATKIDEALGQVGFMTVTNLGFDPALVTAVFAASREFFHSDTEVKEKSAYGSASENFGYQAFGQESLDPTKGVDLKETFTMRNVLDRTSDDSRWPSVEFRKLMLTFYQACLDGAYQLQKSLALALDVAPDYFVKFHSGENVTLRLLYYPAAGVDRILEGQLGAGAHTDYGLLTLLFQDGVGGLQVLDTNDQWQDVEPSEGAIVINSGDMLERWTNGRYRSTLHRVQPKIGQRERFSIAMFVDPDSDTPVAVLDSCVSAANPARYEEITAGEHLQRRIEATHKGKFES